MLELHYPMIQFLIINNMLLSSLWDEIVADDMTMFSVGVMKLLICNVLLKLNSKSYHIVEEKRIIYDAIWKLVTKGIRRFSFFFLTMSRVNEKRVGENGRKRHVKISKVEFRFFFPPIFKPLWRVLWRRRIEGWNIS